MFDPQSNLIPPSSGEFNPELATPSGLTPNTRSEAEAALTYNTLTQTASAAPTTPLATDPSSFDGISDPDTSNSAFAARRPMATSSSHNYEAALAAARKQSTASSGMSADSTEPTGNIAAGNITGGRTVASPTAAVPFPPPGQGVVPLHTGVGSGQAEIVRKAKPSGMKLGELGRQPSWSSQDMKHLLSAEWMKEPGTEDKGYGSGVEHKGAGGD